MAPSDTYRASRMRRCRNFFGVAWIVITAVCGAYSPLFALGSAVGWSFAFLTAAAYAGQMEASRDRT